MGIIVAGSSVKRQSIQRVGRILRGMEGKTAKIYSLYVKNTKDEDWQRKSLGNIYSVAKEVKWE